MIALLGATAAAAQPPLVQPGAPGQANRTITVDQSTAMARSKIDPADVKFMQDMIHHHGQAVEMVALIDGRSDSADMKMMGQRISISQVDEMKMMKTWLERRGFEAPDMTHMGHNMADMPGMDMNTPMMTGMLSPAQMKELTAAKGATFDRLFLQGMIRHHQGALEMVHDLSKHPGAGEESDLNEFTNGVIADQSAEITRMEGMLEARGVSTSAAGTK